MEIRVLASGSKGNCYYVSDGQAPLLIECGIAWAQIQRKLDFKTSEVRACLISHMHQDHCKAMKDLERVGIPCIYPFDNVQPITQVNAIGTWRVYAFDAVHDVPCCGYLLANETTGEKLFYLSDSAYCKYTFPGLTEIMIGCNYDTDLLNENIAAGEVNRGQRSRLIHSHASLQTVKEFLTANDLSKVQGIWLLHLSSCNAEAQRFKQEIQELTGKPVWLPEE